MYTDNDVNDNWIFAHNLATLTNNIYRWIYGEMGITIWKHKTR